MTTQVKPTTTSSASIFRRILKVARGEGPRGIFRRAGRWVKANFGYVGGNVVICPIDERAVMPPNPFGLEVREISPDDPGVMEDLLEICGPPYTADFLRNRWEKLGLLGFIGRINGEPVSSVWVKPEGMVPEFGIDVRRLAADEVYYKDAWTKTAWRGKGLYPLVFALSGQILRQKYGKRNTLNFILYTNRSSINAYRKLGGIHTGHIALIKIFRKKIPIIIPTRPRPL